MPYYVKVGRLLKHNFRKWYLGLRESLGEITLEL